MSDDSPRARCERGSGLLSTTIGVGILITMLGFAVNLTLGLWQRSTVDSVAYDAARRVATAPSGADIMRERQESIVAARALLGPIGERVELSFESPPSAVDVVLHVRAPGVALLPRMISGGPTVAALDRRIVVRRESQ